MKPVISYGASIPSPTEAFRVREGCGGCPVWASGEESQLTLSQKPQCRTGFKGAALVEERVRGLETPEQPQGTLSPQTPLLQAAPSFSR